MKKKGFHRKKAVPVMCRTPKRKVYKGEPACSERWFKKRAMHGGLGGRVEGLRKDIRTGQMLFISTRTSF